MQVQRVNNQQRYSQNEVKYNGTPSFGMKIILGQPLYTSLIDSFTKLKGKSPNSNIHNLKWIVDDFLLNFTRDIATHNAKPKNHRLFKNEIRISDIQVKYRDTEIADGYMLKIATDGEVTPMNYEKKIKNLTDLEKSMKDCDEQQGLATWKKQVEFRVITDGGAEVGYRPYDKNTKPKFKLAKEIQEKIIKKIENENPEFYLYRH